MISVLIAVGIRIYREGLARTLPGICDADVVGTVSHPESLLPAVRELGPDVVLVDARMVEGLETSRILRSNFPELRVVVLALDGTPREVIEWAESGASAYVSCDASLEELATVITDAVDGRLRCSPTVAAKMMERLHSLSNDPTVGAGTDSVALLTGREREVVGLVTRGFSNKKIARILGISISTAKNHVHSILRKLSASSRGEAAAMVRRWQSRASSPSDAPSGPPSPTPDD